jgi:uncharacterized protein (UPF0333 family)
MNENVISSKKINLSKKIKLAWAIVAVVLVLVSVFSFIKYSGYKKAQDAAVSFTLISTSKFNSYKDDYNKMVKEMYRFYNPTRMNVTVNGINFDAYDISGGFNSMDDPYYATDVQTFIGWVAGWSEDAQYTNVKANVTSSKLMGVSGLAAAVELDSVSESHFEGCSLTTGKIAQEALTDFVPVAYDEGMFHNGKKWTLINAAGSMVGFVYNWEDVAKSIEFNNSGAPKFVYEAGNVKDNNKINVLYNDKKHTTLLGLENYPAY